MKKLLSILFSLSLFAACGPDTPVAEQVDAEASPKTDKNDQANLPHMSPPEVVKKTSPTKRVSTGAFPQATEVLQLATIYRQYSRNGKAQQDKIEAELAKINAPQLDFLKSFVFESTQQSHNLMLPRFMKKPAKETLRQVYALRHATWNAMALEPATELLLDTLDLNSISDQDLLTAYYRMIFAPVQASRAATVDYSDFNIDFDKMGLENEQEKAIAFYAGADVFARKYNNYIYGLPDPCKKAWKMTNTFPKFNGQPIFKAKAPKFEEFRVNYSNNQMGKPFSMFFTKNLEKAVKHYTDCNL